MYATNSAWQPPSAPRRTLSRAVCFDLRDRVSPDPNANGNAHSPLHDVSPTDAFFDGPGTFANHEVARQSLKQRQEKYRQIHSEPEKQQAQQEQRPSLQDLHSTRSALARELIGKSYSSTFVNGCCSRPANGLHQDRIVTKGDGIYRDALSRLGDLHKELFNIISETTAEDDRVLKLLEANHRKTAKPPSDTRIGDVRTGGEIQVGERVVFVKDRIDTVEAEVASLWDQWERAQKDVDVIFAELTSARSIGGAHNSSMESVQESLVGEMANFQEELTGLLEDAHEEARASEKVSLIGTYFTTCADLHPPRAFPRRSTKSCLPYCSNIY